MTIYSIAGCAELTAHQAERCRTAFAYGLTQFELEQGVTIVELVVGMGLIIGGIVLYGWLLVDLLGRGDMSGRAKLGGCRSILPKVRTRRRSMPRLKRRMVVCERCQ